MSDSELRGKFDALDGITPEKRMIYAHVDEQSVASVVSDWTGIPVGRMVRDEIETVLKLPEILNRRVQELTSRLDEQSRFLADREFVADRLRDEAESAQKTEAEVRAALVDAEDRHHFATEAIRAEKSLVED